jgi:hypothetical protein
LRLEDHAKLEADKIDEQQATIARLTAIETAVIPLEPYFDQLICYGSTTSEHKPNLLVKNMREALALNKEDKT